MEVCASWRASVAVVASGVACACTFSGSLLWLDIVVVGEGDESEREEEERSNARASDCFFSPHRGLRSEPNRRDERGTWHVHDPHPIAVRDQFRKGKSECRAHVLATREGKQQRDVDRLASQCRTRTALVTFPSPLFRHRTFAKTSQNISSRCFQTKRCGAPCAQAEHRARRESNCSVSSAITCSFDERPRSAVDYRFVDLVGDAATSSRDSRADCIEQQKGQCAIAFSDASDSARS